MAEHWDGDGWTRFTAPPAPPSSYDQLISVSMVSPRDVWAAGYNTDDDLVTTALIEHWDGHRWKRVDVQLPPDTSNSRLYGVSAVSADDVWAVGSARTENSYLLEHWDGRRWTPAQPILKAPSTHIYALRDVSARGPDDVWAVGCRIVARLCQTAIVHWDGAAWVLVPSPNSQNPAYPQGVLNSVTATSASDAWAVGSAGVQTFDPARTLILHWDGHRWMRVRAPNVGAVANQLWDVDAASPDDAWAVGYSSDTDFDNAHDGYLYLHWDGRRWRHVPVPG